MRKTVCIAGKNDIAVHGLDYLIESGGYGNDIIVSCARTDAGVDTWQKSLRKEANYYSVPVRPLEELYGINGLIFISLQYDRIIRTDRFRAGASLINFHFSALPAYKGCHTSVMPILNGEKESGVTIHRINDRIDGGDVIAQRKFAIGQAWNSQELYLKYTEIACALFDEYVERLIEGDYTAERQSPTGATYYSKGSIDYGNIRIDLNQTAEMIDRQVRAYNFKAYQQPTVYGRIIESTEITAATSSKAPGSVIFENEREMMLATVDYDIRLICGGGYFRHCLDFQTSCRQNNLLCKCKRKIKYEKCPSFNYDGFIAVDGGRRAQWIHAIEL